MRKYKIFNKCGSYSGFAIILVIVFFSATNICKAGEVVKSAVTNTEITNLKENLSNTDNQLKEEIVQKRVLQDIYGLAQKSLQKTIVNNFQYIYENDHMHMIKEYPYDEATFIEEVVLLNNELSQKDIPFLYVQGANREMLLDGETAHNFNVDQECMDTIVSQLQEKQINVLDMRQVFLQSNYELDKVFFHTDLHMQTDAEIFVAQQLLDYFVENLGFEIQNSSLLDDMAEFDKMTYPFLGNYVRNLGGYYIEQDYFDLYYPRFETNYVLEDHVSGTRNEGEFRNVVMNQYDTVPNIDKYMYWVTDYLQFTKPYYTIVNKDNPEGKKYLFIMDSMGYRTVSYLSLTASEITILDPRYYNGVDFWDRAINERDYDAVILYQGTFLMGYPLL